MRTHNIGTKPDGADIELKWRVIFAARRHPGSRHEDVFDLISHIFAKVAISAKITRHFSEA
jgi:hypothetical protein